MKYFLFFFMVFYLYAYDPQKIDEKDLINLQNIEKDIYELSSKRKSLSVDEILNFIWEHREIKIEPILERFNLNLSGFAGQRTKQNYYDQNSAYDDFKPYAYLGFQAEFKIIDPKEAREKKEEIRKQRAMIAKMIREFQARKIKISTAKQEIQILKIKDNRLKIRVNQAVSNLDERLENLDKLHNKNLELSLLELEQDEIKSNLLDLVKIEFRNFLKAELEI